MDDIGFFVLPLHYFVLFCRQDDVASAVRRTVPTVLRTVHTGCCDSYPNSCRNVVDCPICLARIPYVCTVRTYVKPGKTNIQPGKTKATQFLLFSKRTTKRTNPGNTTNPQLFLWQNETNNNNEFSSHSSERQTDFSYYYILVETAVLLAILDK